MNLIGKCIVTCFFATKYFALSGMQTKLQSYLWLSKGVKSFSTNTQAEHLNYKTSGGLLTSKPKLPCLVWKEDHHGIAKCPVFASKSMEDKRSFIHANPHLDRPDGQR